MSTPNIHRDHGKHKTGARGEGKKPSPPGVHGSEAAEARRRERSGLPADLWQCQGPEGPLCPGASTKPRHAAWGPRARWRPGGPRSEESGWGWAGGYGRKLCRVRSSPSRSFWGSPFRPAPLAVGRVPLAVTAGPSSRSGSRAEMQTISVGE